MHLHTRNLVPVGQTQVTKHLFASPENQAQPEAPHLRISHACKTQIPKQYFFFLNQVVCCEEMQENYGPNFQRRYKELQNREGKRKLCHC